jgi:hypothetical protein
MACIATLLAARLAAGPRPPSGQSQHLTDRHDATQVAAASTLCLLDLAGLTTLTALTKARVGRPI